MIIIEGTTDFYIEKKTAVSIGKFDGIHRGHKALLQEILAQKEKGLAPAVFTFDVSPGIFFGHREAKELTTKEEKRQLFAGMGVEYLVEFPLNAQTAVMEPENFLRDMITGQMNSAFIAAGTDVSFGYKGRGNAGLLQEKAQEYGYETVILDKLCYQNREISSTYVREELEKGNLQTVKELLGAPFYIRGEVVHGRHLGSTIGMPTVNLRPPAEKLLPPNGVYYASLNIDGQCYKGISNIGYKPTVTEAKIKGVETYIYDFDKEIYGDTIEVYLHEFKRGEVKFHSVEELKKQIHRDAEEGRAYTVS